MKQLLFTFLALTTSLQALPLTTLESQEKLSSYTLIRHKQKNTASYFIKIDSEKSSRIVSSEGNFGPFSKIQTPFFSKSLRFFTFVAKKNNRFQIYLNQNQFGPFQSVGKTKINAEENTWIFSAKTTNGSYLYVVHLSNKQNPAQKVEIRGPYRKISEYALSRDGSRWAYFAQTPEGWFFFNQDEEKIGPYHRLFGLEIKSNGSLFTFVGENSFLWFKGYDRIVNNKSYGAFDEVGKLSANAQGNQWVFPARKGKSWFFINQTHQQFGPFEEIKAPSLTPQKNKWIASGKNQNGWNIIFSDNQTLGPFLKADIPVFSQDDSHWFLRFKKESGWFLLFDNKKQYGPYKKIGSVTTDWKKIAFPVLKKDGVYIFFNDGKEFGPFEETESDREHLNIPISYSGKIWFFRAKKLEGEVIVINQNEYGPFEFSTLPVFSPDKQNWAFWSSGKNHQYRLILNQGKLDAQFINVDYLSPYFSENGKKWIIKGETFEGWYVINEKNEKFGPSVSEPQLFYTKDLKHYLVKINDSRKQFLILTSDKQQYGPYDEIQTVVLSSTGKSWVASARRKDTKLLLINGKEFPYLVTFKVFRSANKDQLFWIQKENQQLSLNQKELK